MTAHPSPNGKLLRFGIFEVDTGSAQLTKNGTRVRLQDQPARVLLHLLEHPGDVVTREELRRALWPEDTFVNFDHGLNIAVNKIRDALGDSASNPRFVETVPKRGYRFIAPVEAVRPAAVEAVPRQPARRSAWRWATAALCLFVTGIGAWYVLSRGSEPPKVVVTPLTSLPGLEWGPSLSPDGDRVAFCWHGASGDNFDIYVKQIGSERLLRITSNPALESGPVWSPDGRWIAFARVLGDQRQELLVVPSMGGVEKTVTTFHSLQGPVKSSPASWGPDSRWIVISDLAGSSKSSYALYRVSVETGERRQLTIPPAAVLGDFEAAVSPDGQSVAFVRRINQSESELSMLKLNAENVASETPLRLLADRHTASEPIWTPDGKELIFQSGRVHLPHLARIRLGEQSPRGMEFGRDMSMMPSIALRANRLSFVRVAWDVNVWRHAIGTHGSGTSTRWAGSSSYVDHVPRYSPDGTRIAFISNRNGIQSLWVCDADGSNPVRLSDFKDEEINDIHWIPDGKRIMARIGSRGYAFDSRNGTVQPLPAPGFPSRDGRYLYFSSKTTGQDEIWKMPLGGGTPVQITRNGGFKGKESVDGRYLYYSKVNGGTSVWRVPVSAGVEQKVLDAVSTPMNFDVTIDGVYFIPPAQSDGRSTISFLRFATGKVETVTRLDKEAVWGFSVSPDGQSILFTQVDQFNSDLMLVDNFQ